MSANEHIEELLSGFLDGELTAEELREFELAMAVDTTLAARLEQYRQFGSALRSAPKRTLGPDFASRVLAAVHEQKREVAKPASASGRIVPILAGVAAVAASLLLALYASNWFAPNDQKYRDPIAVVPTDPNSPDVIDPVAVPEGGPRVDSNGVGANGGESTLVRKTPMQRVFEVLTIFEIETSEDAWNRNVVRNILQKEGIAWTSPVAATEEVIKVLNETRSISQGLPATAGTDTIALVLVQASGRAIDAALVDIFQNKEDFPYVMMDIAFDMPGKELLEKVSGKSSFAMPITAAPTANAGLDNVGQFMQAPSAKRLKPLDRHEQVFLAAAEAETSNVLLVIRKAAK